MKLTLEQIKACAVGALRVWEEPDGFHFARMSEEMEQAFKALRKTFYPVARSTTDCRLDFHTDSRQLRVDLDVETIENNVRGKYEIFVDGLPRQYVVGAGKQVLTMELPKGDKRITVALPCHNVGRICLVMVDNGSYIRPHSFDRKMLFLGDSITQGYNAAHDAQSFTNNVARYFNAESLNWAVGGSFFDASVLEKTAFEPDVVTVGYGTNDFVAMASPEDLHRHCTDYLDKLKLLYGDKKVFVISPIWRTDGELRRAAGTLSECREMIAQEAEARGFVHIDGFQLFPHEKEYFADGYLHPNDLGFAHYSLNLIKALTPLI